MGCELRRGGFANPKNGFADLIGSAEPPFEDYWARQQEGNCSGAVIIVYDSWKMPHQYQIREAQKQPCRRDCSKNGSGGVSSDWNLNEELDYGESKTAEGTSL